MESIKKKLTTLRAEVDEALTRENGAKEEAAKARQDADRVRRIMQECRSGKHCSSAFAGCTAE